MENSTEKSVSSAASGISVNSELRYEGNPPSTKKDSAQSRAGYTTFTIDVPTGLSSTAAERKAIREAIQYLKDVLKRLEEHAFGENM